MNTLLPQVNPQSIAAINYLRRGKFSPQALAWYCEHLDYLPAEYGGDRRKHALLMRGHLFWVASNADIESKAYFDFLDIWIQGGLS